MVKVLLWLNAAFMPIWAASWVLPAGLKGARDARFAMWVSMLGCRVVAGVRWDHARYGRHRCLAGDVPRLGGARRVVLLAYGQRALAVVPEAAENASATPSSAQSGE